MLNPASQLPTRVRFLFPTENGFHQAQVDRTVESGADASSGPQCRHRMPHMAVADNLVELVIGQFEKALRLAIGVILQPLLT